MKDSLMQPVLTEHILLCAKHSTYFYYSVQPSSKTLKVEIFSSISCQFNLPHFGLYWGFPTLPFQKHLEKLFHRLCSQGPPGECDRKS